MKSRKSINRVIKYEHKFPVEFLVGRMYEGISEWFWEERYENNRNLEQRLAFGESKFNKMNCALIGKS